MTARVSSFAYEAGVLMILMSGLTSAKEAAPHLRETSASPRALSIVTGRVMSLTHAHLQSHPPTKARLTNNDFSKGGDGGDPSECDRKYHNNSELIVALSTGWFKGRSRCGRMIRITASNRRSVTAKVVDECDSMHGCDKGHAYQPPCGNNIVDGSDAVWSRLGLNKAVGVVDVTWSMA
ncbi:hypothetical protein SCA6_010004 [Theobroma cacao]|uniref:Kiwellin, putative n=1 Tax=Theobroma cacao TaxID=3641 RepID=A0A061H0A0_THECC|nr:Kiwellin, putative [Theobroma cacao]